MNVVLVFEWEPRIVLFNHRARSTEVIVATAYFATREGVPNNVEKSLPNMMASRFVNTIDNGRGVVR